MLKEKSLNNVRNASFGYKKTKDAIIWLVNANFNFVISAEEFIWSVSVYKKQNNKCREDKDSLNKDVEKSNKELKSWIQKKSKQNLL